MDIVFTILGWLLGIVVIFSIGMWGLYAMLRVVESILDKWLRSVENEAVRRAANSMLNDSHWFSESRDAWLAVNVYAAALQKDACVEIHKTREEWRRRRAVQDAHATQDA